MARSGAVPVGGQDAEGSEDLKEAARGLIYWGPVLVHGTIGGTEFTTALFPKDGRYPVPVKVAVPRTEAIGEGAIVEVVLRLNAAPGRAAAAVGGISGRWSSSVFYVQVCGAQPV